MSHRRDIQDILSSSTTQQATGSRTNLLSLLRSRAEETLGQDPTETRFFQSGLGNLRELLSEQAELDEAQAVRRGAAGSALGIAQLGQRNEALVGGIRGLLSGSEQFLAGERRTSISQLLQGQSLLDLQSRFQQDLQLRNARRRDERRARNQALVGSLVQSGTSLIGSFVGGG